MWIGMSGSILNCSSGWISIATSVLVVVPRVFRLRYFRGDPLAPPIARSRADTGHGAVDVQHPGGNPKKEQDDHPPRPGPEPTIDRPTHRGRDNHRNHEFDADAEAETKTLLQRRAIANRWLPPHTLRPRLVEPFAKSR